MLEGSQNRALGVVTYHKVVLKKKHRRNHSQGASGENPSPANEPVARRMKSNNKGTRTAKITLNIWSIDEKNREEQRQQQAEEQSQRQANQTKGLRPRQGEVRGETPYRGTLQPASLEASKNRCRCPAGALRAEVGEGITTIPKIDFDEDLVEYKKIIQTAQKQRIRKSRRF